MSDIRKIVLIGKQNSGKSTIIMRLYLILRCIFDSDTSAIQIKFPEYIKRNFSDDEILMQMKKVKTTIRPEQLQITEPITKPNYAISIISPGGQDEGAIFANLLNLLEDLDTINIGVIEVNKEEESIEYLRKVSDEVFGLTFSSIIYNKGDLIYPYDGAKERIANLVYENLSYAFDDVDGPQDIPIIITSTMKIAKLIQNLVTHFFGENGVCYPLLSYYAKKQFQSKSKACSIQYLIL